MILVLAAHPDDEVLGCGGTINRLIRINADVVTVNIFSKGRKDPLDQYFDKYPIRYWITKIEKLVGTYLPMKVFTHHPNDLNRDHRIIYEATRIACRSNTSVEEIYAYEVPTSVPTENFKPNFYVPLAEMDIKFKIDRMKTVYAKELRQFPHPRSVEGIRYLARVRGMECGSKYAEAFEMIWRVYL